VTFKMTNQSGHKSIDTLRLHPRCTRESRISEVNRSRIAVFPHSTELSVFVEINGMTFLQIENSES
jgi:hypothetical protein